MAYMTYTFCALTVLWLVYLLMRSRKLRAPGRLGVCRNVSLPERCALVVELIVFMAIAIWASAQDEQGVWALLLPLLLLSTGFVVVLSLQVRSAMAFTAEGFLICGLFGVPKWYAWADVTDCRTMKTVVPRSNKLCCMYSLRLTDRNVALYDDKPDTCAFINELRRHKPMMNIPVPGRRNK